MKVTSAHRRAHEMSIIPEVAHHMGLVPLAFLAVRRERRPEWWWLAVVFGVSWLADTAAHWVDPWLVSAVYPLSQAALIGAVLLPRGEARRLLGALVGLGLVAVVLPGPPELFLHTVAWGVIVGLVWPLPLGRLRTALLVAFGLGWLAWIGYTLWPGWWSWGVYQGVRAVSLGLFCWAVTWPRPLVRLG